MRDLAFVLPIEPPHHTAQQTGLRAVIGEDGKPFIIHYKKAELKRVEREYCDALRPYAPPAPLSPPVAVSLAFYYPSTQQNAARMKRAGVALVRRQTKPDLDNASKSALDALTRCGFVIDDSHIAQLFIQKFETIGTPRIAVRVRELGPFPGELFEPKDAEDANAAAN